MAEKNRDSHLSQLTNDLTKAFARWDHLFSHGGQDPFWPDGVNLNLVRNHILHYKRSIAEIVEADQDEPSFFGVTYPDIYYRATPDEVPRDYMAKADEIRKRAQEQLALYEQDPNFCYILENHSKVFPKGETRATKEAGLSIWNTCGLSKYRQAFESGDLVSMRRDFYEPYEAKAKRWAEGAEGLKAFFEMEHSPEDNVPIPDEFDAEEYPEGDADLAEDFEEEVAPDIPAKPSLDALISNAKTRSDANKTEHISKEEQMSLF